MKLSRESIFISSIRAFFNTLLGTIGVVIAIIPILILFSIFSSADQKQGAKNKLEILPDLNGNTKTLALNSPAILQLDINGIIGKAHLTSKDFNYQLIESRKGILKNNRVKAILLNINSPGGTANDSDDMYRNLLAYKEKYNVPIYAYVDGLCASGGFYIACACDKIYASPNSIIGSVGSLMGPFFNFSKAMDTYGIEAHIITDGKDKDMMNPFRKWKKDEDASLKVISDYGYQLFVNIVASARNINKDTLINEYGANVFDTEKAQNIGYIDRGNSSYSATLEDLLDVANIDKDKSYQVIGLSPKKTWCYPFLSQAKIFFESLLKDLLLSAKYVNAK